MTLAFLLNVAGCATTATSNPAVTDVDIDASIGTVDLAGLQTAMASGALIVDARGAGSFANGHIDDAINIPCRDDDALSRLPEDKAHQVIFYCGGPKCPASSKAATKAIALGHTNVAEFKGGFPVWLEAKHPIPVLDLAEVNTATANGAMLVDARSAESYAAGHIDGAINIPCRDRDAYSQLPENKDTQLIFYCGGPQCRASNKGALKAMMRGHMNVAEFKGGFPAWSATQSAQ